MNSKLKVVILGNAKCLKQYKSIAEQFNVNKRKSSHWYNQRV